MKIPLSWLQQYIDLSLPIKEIAQALTMSGLEVEHLEMGNDPVFEIALTPNLGHCMSIYGVARELSALLNLPLKQVAYHPKEAGDPIANQIRVSLLDKRQCPRYACRIVRNVRVAPSPEWLQQRLIAAGIRPINNIVDIGNYVMLDRGQPLHLFDYDTIADHHLIITSQTDYLSLATLDGVSRDIPPSALLICDTKQPLAFAGILGGADSGVSDTTCHVLIEAAYFTSASIRKTSKLLGVRTDASQRFEKGIDPNGLEAAINMAAHLLTELAQGTCAPGIIDIAACAFSPKTLTCRLHRINEILGTQLSLNEVLAMFQRLQFPVLEETAHACTLAIPTHRNDIVQEIDLIEEIARLYGYPHIQNSKGQVANIGWHPHDPQYLLENLTRNRLLTEGLRECITCNLIGPSQVTWQEHPIGSSALISVLHPHSIDQSILRPSLLPGLLQIVQYNLNHDNPHLHAFEIGNVHFREQDRLEERPMVGIILTGQSAPHHWSQKPNATDFFDLKGILENLLIHQPLTLLPSHLPYFHPTRQSYVHIGNHLIGTLGEIHPDYALHLGISERVYFAEIDLHAVRACTPHYPPVALFPGSERDWTITLPIDMPIDLIFQSAKRHAPSQLEHISLLDLYKSDKIGQDRKNATFRFYYRENQKTIDFETVEREHARLIQSITCEVSP